MMVFRNRSGATGFDDHKSRPVCALSKSGETAAVRGELGDCIHAQEVDAYRHGGLDARRHGRCLGTGSAGLSPRLSGGLLSGPIQQRLATELCHQSPRFCPALIARIYQSGSVASCPRVLTTTRCSAVVPRSMHAAGVDASRPYLIRPSVSNGNRSCPIKITRVPGPVAKACQRTQNKPRRW